MGRAGLNLYTIGDFPKTKTKSPMILQGIAPRFPRPPGVKLGALAIGNNFAKQFLFHSVCRGRTQKRKGGGEWPFNSWFYSRGPPKNTSYISFGVCFAGNQESVGKVRLVPKLYARSGSRRHPSPLKVSDRGVIQAISFFQGDVTLAKSHAGRGGHGSAEP